METVQKMIVDYLEKWSMSMRDFARKAGIDVANLSRFLSQDQKLQRRTAQAICTAANFNLLERRQFLRLLGYVILADHVQVWHRHAINATVRHAPLDLEWIEQRLRGIKEVVDGEVAAGQRNIIIQACGEIISQLEAARGYPNDARWRQAYVLALGIGANMLRDEGSLLPALHTFQDAIELARTLPHEIIGEWYIERGNVALMLGGYTDANGYRAVKPAYQAIAENDLLQGISHGTSRQAVRAYYHLSNLAAKMNRPDGMTQVIELYKLALQHGRHLSHTNTADAFDLAYLYERQAHILARAGSQGQIRFTRASFDQVQQWLALSAGHHPHGDLLFQIEQGLVRSNAYLGLRQKDDALATLATLRDLATQNQMPYQIRAVERAVQIAMQ